MEKMEAQQVTFKILRFNPQTDTGSRFESFAVSTKKGMTVLEGLIQVMEKQDPSLSMRFACREGVCGSCSMFINGSYRLACQTQIADLKSKDVTVSPLPHLPLIKDLVVDMEPFFEKIEIVEPYLQKLSAPPEKEILQSPKQRQAINEVIDCILCGCCYSACPETWGNRDFLGPAALIKAYRFVADSRDEARNDRISMVANDNGVWRCRTVFNCVESCPKNINQTYAIQQLKRKAFIRRLRFWETAKR